ncbi:MAG: chorismate synthase [Clostridiales bacterium]|jgi:chorismate synthase|nr:chorismate synthase [Clostridiales bacterium]
MLRYLTAGESHGKALVGILDGLPRGLTLNIDIINHELYLRQTSYGRGNRKIVENDTIEILAGVRGMVTTGNPVAFVINNVDHWQSILDPIDGDNTARSINRPRPGHADMPGMHKYGINDARDVSERASARDTATRCAIGSICNQLLQSIGINLYAAILEIGKVKVDVDIHQLKKYNHTDIYGIFDKDTSTQIKREIDNVRLSRDTVGGKIALVANGVPIGLGSYTQHDLKLDCIIAASLISLQTVKSVEFGIGNRVVDVYGSQMQDAMYYDEFGNIRHKSNNAGGITGGMSNGNDIVVQCSLKPIPTVLKGIPTVDLSTKTNEISMYERSDICHVPAALIVAKNILAFVLTRELLNHTGAVTMQQLADRLK